MDRTLDVRLEPANTGYRLLTSAGNIYDFTFRLGVLNYFNQTAEEVP